MSTPDSFLVAWWLLTVTLIVSGLLLVKRQRAANQQAALIALNGGWTGRYAPPMPAKALPRAIPIIGGVLILVWLAGIVAFTWMSHWTRLLLVNFQLLGVLFGAGCVGVGLSSRASAMAATYPGGGLPRAVMRPLMTLFGLASIAMGSYWVVGDLVFPKVIVEGRISSVSHTESKMDTYSIVIDGERYDTLRDVFLTVSEGDRVRAEVGAASKKVLRAGPIH